MGETHSFSHLKALMVNNRTSALPSRAMEKQQRTQQRA